MYDSYRLPNTARRRQVLVIAVALHVLLAWLWVSGTGRHALTVLQKPLQAVVIQEVMIPPPPPPPSPPKVIKSATPQQQAPAPHFVPEPEVKAPPSAAPSIPAVMTPTAEPVAISSPAPVAAPALLAAPVTAPLSTPPAPPTPPAPAVPVKQDIAVACPSQVKPKIPTRALQEGVSGVVRAQALIHDGVVKEVTILSGPRVFHSAVRSAMLQYKCTAEAGDVIAVQEFTFTVEED